MLVVNSIINNLLSVFISLFLVVNFDASQTDIYFYWIGLALFPVGATQHVISYTYMYHRKRGPINFYSYFLVVTGIYLLTFSVIATIYGKIETLAILIFIASAFLISLTLLSTELNYHGRHLKAQCLILSYRFLTLIAILVIVNLQAMIVAQMIYLIAVAIICLVVYREFFKLEGKLNILYELARRSMILNICKYFAILVPFSFSAFWDSLVSSQWSEGALTELNLARRAEIAASALVFFAYFGAFSKLSLEDIKMKRATDFMLLTKKMISFGVLVSLFGGVSTYLLSDHLCGVLGLGYCNRITILWYIASATIVPMIISVCIYKHLLNHGKQNVLLYASIIFLIFYVVCSLTLSTYEAVGNYLAYLVSWIITSSFLLHKSKHLFTA